MQFSTNNRYGDQSQSVFWTLGPPFLGWPPLNWSRDEKEGSGTTEIDIYFAALLLANHIHFVSCRYIKPMWRYKHLKMLVRFCQNGVSLAAGGYARLERVKAQRFCIVFRTYWGWISKFKVSFALDIRIKFLPVLYFEWNFRTGTCLIFWKIVLWKERFSNYWGSRGFISNLSVALRL